MTASPRIRSFAGLLLLVTATLTLPMVIGRGGLKRDYFDPTILGKVNREKPEILLLGNSMLDTRLDLEHLREIAGDRRVSELANGATASASWFLQLKNFAIASDKPPKMVVIFFRDNVLTQPGYRTSGQNYEYLRGLMHGTDPDLARVLGLSDESFRLETLPRRLYPVLDDRGYLKRRLTLLIQDIASGSGSKYPLQRARSHYFRLSNLRSDLPAEFADPAFGPLSALQFDPEGTFLPEYVRLADENGIELVFFRVKRRPDREGVRPQPEELANYIGELRTWIEANGAVLIDESADTVLKLEHYNDGDHLHQSARRQWTDQFWGRLAPVLENPATDDPGR